MSPRCLTAALIALAFGLTLAPADASAGKIYFIDFGPRSPGGAQPEAFSLQRVNLDGSGRETVVADIGPQPWNNSLAVSGGRLYWRTYQNETWAATVGGDLLGPTAPPDAHVAAAVLDRVLDAAGVYTYSWASGPDAIVRTRDGQEPETVVSTRQFSPPASVALDEGNGRIYWAGAWNDRPSGAVQRADLGGEREVETLLENFTDDDYHVDLALDLAGEKLYLGNNDHHTIQRANLDGSGLEDVVTGTYVFAIALDSGAVPEPGGLGVAAVWGGWVLMRRRRRLR